MPEKLLTKTGKRIHLPRERGGALCGLNPDRARPCFKFVEGVVCKTCLKVQKIMAERKPQK